LANPSEDPSVRLDVARAALILLSPPRHFEYVITRDAQVAIARLYRTIRPTLWLMQEHRHAFTHPAVIDPFLDLMEDPAIPSDHKVAFVHIIERLATERLPAGPRRSEVVARLKSLATTLGVEKIHEHLKTSLEATIPAIETASEKPTPAEAEGGATHHTHRTTQFSGPTPPDHEALEALEWEEKNEDLSDETEGLAEDLTSGLDDEFKETLDAAGEELDETIKIKTPDYIFDILDVLKNKNLLGPADQEHITLILTARPEEMPAKTVFLLVVMARTLANQRTPPEPYQTILISHFRDVLFHHLACHPRLRNTVLEEIQNIRDALARPSDLAIPSEVHHFFEVLQVEVSNPAFFGTAGFTLREFPSVDALDPAPMLDEISETTQNNNPRVARRFLARLKDMYHRHLLRASSEPGASAAAIALEDRTLKLILQKERSLLDILEAPETPEMVWMLVLEAATYIERLRPFSDPARDSISQAINNRHLQNTGHRLRTLELATIFPTMPVFIFLSDFVHETDELVERATYLSLYRWFQNAPIELQRRAIAHLEQLQFYYQRDENLNLVKVKQLSDFLDSLNQESGDPY
ncbi:MAG: hypothetical protein HY390_01465, partial [Deltaproteobacteria bacterium]|nr:hypothetical protein [Deltaproteobacteria bacterium]